MAPAAIALAGVIVSAAAGGYAAYSANQTAKFNEAVADNEARFQRQRGRAEENLHRRKVAQIMGEAKVAAAKSGVSLLSGSVQDVFEDSYEDAEFDAIMIRSGAMSAANSSIMQARNYGRQATAAAVSGVGSVGATLLTGASNYTRMQAA